MVQKKIRTVSLRDFVLTALLVLSAMNFLLQGSYLVIILFVLCVLFYQGRMLMNNTAFLLLGLAISHILLEAISGGDLNFRIAAAPCAYMAAYRRGEDRPLDYPERTLHTIAYAMAAHSLLSLVYTFALYGSGIFYTGRCYDVWSGTVASATGLAANYYFAATTIPSFFHKRSFWKTMIHSLVFAGAILHDVLIGGRVFLVLCLIALVGATLVWGLIERRISTLMKVLWWSVISGVLFALAYENDLFGLKTTFETSYMYRRFFQANAMETLSNTSRWSIKGKYLEHLLDYPFGGNHMLKEFGRYAHDIWLDVYDTAGAPTMLLMLAYTLTSALRFVRYAASPLCQDSHKALFYLFPAIMLASFFVEPILSGAPMVLFMYCYMDGTISRKLAEKGKESSIPVLEKRTEGQVLEKTDELEAPMAAERLCNQTAENEDDWEQDIWRAMANRAGGDNP